jgi:hypothetical protein
MAGVSPDPGWWAGLFEPQPEQWGLRGDPYAWQSLADTVSRRPRPGTIEQLDADLKEAFRQVVGVPLEYTREESIAVPEFAHGGMSSGMIHMPTWRERLMPLLRERGARTM